MAPSDSRLQPAVSGGHSTSVDCTFPAHPGNYAKGRAGIPVDRIIIHTTESSSGSALNWFANEKANCSAHYLITKDGRIYRCVDEENTAYHCGNLGYNRRSIGIECEGHMARLETWTPELVYSLRVLLGNIAERYNIELSRGTVIGHFEVPDPMRPGQFGGINHHMDPGPYCPWDLILETTVRYPIKIAEVKVADPIVTPGNETTEYTFTKWQVILGIVATAIGGITDILVSLKDSFPAWGWVGPVVTGLGLITSLLATLGYTRGRSLVKAAASSAQAQQAAQNPQ